MKLGVGKLGPDYGIWTGEVEFTYKVTQQGSIMLSFTFVRITLVLRVEGESLEGGVWSVRDQLGGCSVTGGIQRQEGMRTTTIVSKCPLMP